MLEAGKWCWEVSPKLQLLRGVPGWWKAAVAKTDKKAHVDLDRKVSKYTEHCSLMQFDAVWCTLVSTAKSASGPVSIKMKPQVNWSDESRFPLLVLLHMADQVHVCHLPGWIPSTGMDYGNQIVWCFGQCFAGSCHQWGCYFNMYHLPKKCRRPFTHQLHTSYTWCHSTKMAHK